MFGPFLVVTGIKMRVLAAHKPDLDNNLPTASAARPPAHHAGFHGQAFFVCIGGVRHAMPMFLVLLMIEASDLVFAVDGIAAIYAATCWPSWRSWARSSWRPGS